MGNSENSSYWGGSIPRLEDYGQDERLNLKSVKLYTDGNKCATFTKTVCDYFALQVHWDHGVRHFWSPTLTSQKHPESCEYLRTHSRILFRNSAKMDGVSSVISFNSIRRLSDP